MFAALTAIEPGLSVENIITASDNLMALKPATEALEKLRVRAARDLELMPAGEDKQQKVVSGWFKFMRDDGQGHA